MSTEFVPAEKSWFSVELKMWPVGTIPLMARAIDEEDAELQAQHFLWLHRWKGRVGEVKCLERKLLEASP